MYTAFICYGCKLSLPNVHMLVLHNFFENQFSVFSFFQIILRNTILKGTSLACFISENRLEEIMAFVTKWHTKMVYKYCEGCLLEHYWSSKSLWRTIITILNLKWYSSGLPIFSISVQFYHRHCFWGDGFLLQLFMDRLNYWVEQ